MFTSRRSRLLGGAIIAVVALAAAFLAGTLVPRAEVAPTTDASECYLYLTTGTDTQIELIGPDAGAACSTLAGQTIAGLAPWAWAYGPPPLPLVGTPTIRCSYQYAGASGPLVVHVLDTGRRYGDEICIAGGHSPAP